MKTAKKNKGFTLVEILAVLLILGIIAAVAVKKFTDLESNGNALKAKYEEKAQTRYEFHKELLEK